MNNRRFNLGFSLIEMAVVLAIVAVLLAGLLPTITSQIEQQRRTETRKLLDELRASLIGFATSRTPPRLPCPANPALVTGANTAGTENCSISTGVVPWVTLGTSETDAWGRRFSYAVASSVAGGNFATSFTLASVGNLTVLNTPSGNCGTNTGCVASGVPAIIISHGPNGYGAYTELGTRLPYSSDSSEQTNYSMAASAVSRDIGPSYDDIVVWLSPNSLFNRMVSAGKLP